MLTLLSCQSYANALEYSASAVQYHDRKQVERTPDEVLNDIYGVHLFYW